MTDVVVSDYTTPFAIGSWFYYETNGGGGTNEYYTYMVDNGTDYSTSIDDPTDPTWISRFDSTMPNGGGAWTEARVDAYEIGMATDDANKDIWCYTAYKMVACNTTAATPNISNAPSTEDLGVVEENSTYYAYGSAPSNPVQDGECTFTITNSTGVPVDLDVKTQPSWGPGDAWYPTSDSPGSQQMRITVYYSGQNPASGVVLTSSDQTFATSVSSTLKWDFKFETGEFTDGVEKTGNIIFTASIS